MMETLDLPLTARHVLGLAGALLVAAWIGNTLIARQKRSKLPLPPAPKGVPILGVTGEMLDTQVKAWRKFQKWSQELGAKGASLPVSIETAFPSFLGPDLLRIETLAQTSIVINSSTAAQTLLTKRGGIYADRPVRCEMLGFSERL